MGKNYHVLPHNDGWAVKREGNERPTEVCDTKQEAIEKGKEMAKREKCELIIHRKDGTIETSYSYGNDPYPPKG